MDMSPHRQPPTPAAPAQRRPFSRRGFLAAAGTLAAATAVAGCSAPTTSPAGLHRLQRRGECSTLVYWNLLTGGDGTHMEEMEAYYTKTHPGVNLQSTILTWGNPYYTKLALAIRSGSPPDVAIMHLSRINEFGPPGLLTPLSLDLLAAHGMEPEGLHAAGVLEGSFQRPSAGHSAGYAPVRAVLQHQAVPQGRACWTARASCRRSRAPTPCSPFCGS